MEQAMGVAEEFNQSPPYVDIDLYASDRPLQSAVAANGGEHDAAAVAALAVERALVAELMPKIMSRRYDPHFRPWWEKTGITLGMGITEKQGGTDVRTNTTRAEPAGEGYGITGHKWFMSAPMCDAFLVLAQAAGGLTCFLMPRFRPDGSINALHFQRLKDKLGNRSNASSEVEFTEAFAWRVGEEGRGVRTIIEMD